MSLAKVIVIVKHSVKLHCYLLCGGVTACLGRACVLCAVQSKSSAHTPYWDMLPHHRITNKDVTLLNVLISI